MEDLFAMQKDPNLSFEEKVMINRKIKILKKVTNRPFLSTVHGLSKEDKEQYENEIMVAKIKGEL